MPPTRVTKILTIRDEALRSHSLYNGTMIRRMGAMIVSIVINNGAKLFTYNTSHFNSYNHTVWNYYDLKGYTRKGSAGNMKKRWGGLLLDDLYVGPRHRDDAAILELYVHHAHQALRL